MTNDPALPISSIRQKAIAYARVSTPGQADQEAILTQLKKIRKKARREGFLIVDTITEVQNGALTSQEDRPGLHMSLKAAVDQDCVIMTVNPSRLSRNAEHAKQLDEEHPGWFVFVKRAKGYDDKAWSIEVAEKHAPLPSKIADGTAVAMHSLQRKGLLRGAPDGGKAGRAASMKVRSEAAKVLAEQIADFLEEDPARQRLNRPALVPLLNAAKIRTTRGETFTISRLKRPHDAAKNILATRTAIAKTSVLYGPLRGAGESSAANDDVALNGLRGTNAKVSVAEDALRIVDLHPASSAVTVAAHQEDQAVRDHVAPERELT